MSVRNSVAQLSGFLCGLSEARLSVRTHFPCPPVLSRAPSSRDQQRGRLQCRAFHQSLSLEPPVKQCYRVWGGILKSFLALETAPRDLTQSKFDSASRPGPVLPAEESALRTRGAWSADCGLECSLHSLQA